MRAIGSFGYSSSRTVTPIAPAPTEEIVTSTPSTAPVTTVSATVDAGEYAPSRSAPMASNRWRNSSAMAVSNSITPSTVVMTWEAAAAGQVEMRNHQQGQRGGRDAAAGEAHDDRPFHGVVGAVHGGADRFGNGGIEQIGADRGGRMDAEEQYQDRRHQRSAADAGLPDQQADEEAGHDIERMNRREEMHGRPRAPWLPADGAAVEWPLWSSVAPGTTDCGVRKNVPRGQAAGAGRSVLGG